MSPWRPSSLPPCSSCLRERFPVPGPELRRRGADIALTKAQGSRRGNGLSFGPDDWGARRRALRIFPIEAGETREVAVVSHCRWCRGWRGFPSRGPPRRHRRSARRQQILDQAVRVATRAGDRFVGFFAVQFDFAAGLHILAILRRRGRPRFSSDESCFNLICLGRGLEKHIPETSSAPFSCRCSLFDLVLGE